MVELGTKEFWDRLRNDPALLASEVCTIDIANLDQTLQIQPALRAWVNATYEVARIAEERLKWEVTKAKAVAHLKVRREVDPTTKKVISKTVGQLGAEVDLDENVQHAIAALLEQQETRAALRAMTDALEDRKDMLIQIAAKQRKELADYR